MNDPERISPHQSESKEPPRHIGRYRVERVLGQGGFGIVYLAWDGELNRSVAIKVPHPELVTRAEDAELYRNEARTVAGLDHPNLVTVYDVGATPEFPFFVVSKYVEGSDLKQRLKDARPSVLEAVELTATVAETLHYAHGRGLVHRDIKPGNILLDRSGKPYVADFGLALKEENVGTGPRFAGTPAYMSPEQARGEGHRVDGRSDVFSLGIVFYELLTRRRPFAGQTRNQVLEQIIAVEARPLCQWDDTIPRELERICLKALAKRAADRYLTARDLADDLRSFLEHSTDEEKEQLRSSVSAGGGDAPGQATTPIPSPLPTPASDAEPIKIVPKGLRSFDAQDADFFLELLPGSRDRGGLPDSIRFWKTRIEETDGDATFAVGLIYGPSGCGKSSLVKAGLLPRLADTVIPVYLEATAEETETRLLKGLRKHCPNLPENLGVIETLAALRRGRYFPAGQKVLLVLDQFEQWLHANRNQENTALVQALRHCDGSRVQCLVLVRDDFWMAATRFMRELEVRLLEGQNSAAVDLFPLRHAEKVLTAFGRAFGALPEGEATQPLDPSLQALVSRLEHLSDQYRYLQEGVLQAIQIAKYSPEGALTLSRKALEFVIRDVYKRRINEPPGTRPLENLLQRIVKDGHFPDRLDAYANTIRKLGNVGTHGFGEKVTVADVHQSLTQLVPILTWYLEVERPEALAGRQRVPPQPRGIAGGPRDASGEYRAFLEQAVSGLAQDGKVICVRLALFAEMMKGKAWTPATLKEVGGTEGIGVTFLEETFSAATAPPEHRYHQKAARRVLKALLPEWGTDIKGHMRSHAELLAASGYANCPRDFDDLLRILDSEIRLLTPTDPEGVTTDEGQGASEGPLPTGEKYYQLTHDYLVTSLRDWLTRKQKETRRGRAELLLADRAAVWTARPENRQLPSLLQWVRVRLLTTKKNWTAPQRQMMRKATRYHALRGLALMAFAVLATLVGLGVQNSLDEQSRAKTAAGLVQKLLVADAAGVPDILQDMEDYRGWTDPLLRQEYARARDDSRAKLYASLALLPVDEGQVEYLYTQLLKAGPTELPLIREALRGHKDTLAGRLWAVLENEAADNGQRFRAACVLADYDVSEDEANRNRWQGVLPMVADWMLVSVQQNPSHYTPLRQTLAPLRQRLVGPLKAVFRSGQRPDSDRSWAGSILADYAADQAEVLADLLLDADDRQFAALWPKIEAERERAAAVCQATVETSLEMQKTEEDKEKLAKRQANAGVTLLRLGRPEKVWPLLKHSPDPRARSYLIHRFGPLGVEAGALVKRLDEEPDVTIRRALILSLGAEEFGEKAWTLEGKKRLAQQLHELYRTAADPGLHAAAEWLLRQWKEVAWLQDTDAAWAKDKEQREKWLEEIKEVLAREGATAPPRWYVTGQGQTVVVIPGPVKFLMGSPSREVGREGGPEGTIEMQHQKRIGRSFAIATKTVTVDQFLRFRKDHEYRKEYVPTGDCPVNDVTWYDAAAYCNWLSQQEGIPPDQWCYLPNAADEFAEGMKAAPDYLERTGYRLPTEAEWEYTCRAGAVTSRYYGETEKLLGKYAWFTKNSLDSGVLPGGNLKPNDLGLFDMLGNMMEWCQEKKTPYAPGDDREDKSAITNKDSRIIRGGSFSVLAALVRSAYRGWIQPTVRNVYVGFRPARTFR
jgi:serine/threonine protein kinase/formylglycine-generating enzyme required for sulfatase activity